MDARDTVEPDGAPVHDNAGVARCVARGRCRMHVVGYLHGSRRRRGGHDPALWRTVPGRPECDSPLAVRCRDCGAPGIWPCRNHRESKCRPCAGRYRRRLVRIAESGCQRAEGYLYMLTLTAPGDRQHSVVSTGKICPCTPAGGVDLARWNATHSRRWNHYRTRLRQAFPDLQYLRAIEVQVRGALHDHALVWSPVPLELEPLRELAMAAGFGHSVDLAPIAPGSRRAAYYVAKYVAKATDQRADVPWWGERVDRRTGEISMGLVDGRYRTWSSSREWGLTMRAVRSIVAEFARTAAAERHAVALSLLAEELGAAPVETAARGPD